MIATAGLRLLGCGPKDEAYLLTTAITLVAALTLPPAAAAQKEWFAALPPTGKLFLGNAVVIAITLGILLNALLRAVLRSPSPPTPLPSPPGPRERGATALPQASAIGFSPPLPDGREGMGEGVGG